VVELVVATSACRLWSAAANIGLGYPFPAAVGLAIVVMIITRLPAYRLSIDFTTDLNLEPAPVTMFPNYPAQLPEPQQGAGMEFAPSG
jgi:hypothetical protein